MRGLSNDEGGERRLDARHLQRRGDTLRQDSKERQDPDDDRDDADDVAVAADRCPGAREVVADARDHSERGDREDESGQNERDADDAQEVEHAEDEGNDADRDLEWPERADDASASLAAYAVIEEEQTGDDGDEGGQDGELRWELESTYAPSRDAAPPEAGIDFFLGVAIPPSPDAP
jgi:hypothetical protein